MAQESKSRKLDQYPVRLPDGMRDQIKAAAAANNRSMNAEIVARLESPLGMTLRDWFAGQALSGAVPTAAWARDINLSYMASRLYEIADAMLAERSK